MSKNNKHSNLQRVGHQTHKNAQNDRSDYNRRFNSSSTSPVSEDKIMDFALELELVETSIDMWDALRNAIIRCLENMQKYKTTDKKQSMTRNNYLRMVHMMNCFGGDPKYLKFKDLYSLENLESEYVRKFGNDYLKITLPEKSSTQEDKKRFGIIRTHLAKHDYDMERANQMFNYKLKNQLNLG